MRGSPALRPIRTRFYGPPDTYQPIAAINTTPLIDMMLVLLIMFIVAIPLQTHKVPLDLPPPNPGRAEDRPVHRLDIDAAGQLFWNGRAVAMPELRRRLAALAAEPVEPTLHLDANGAARYELVDQILAEVQRAGLTRLGFVDNQRFVRDLDR